MVELDKSKININEYEIHNTFKNKGYIISIDVLNNIIATTNNKNIINIYDINKQCEIINYNIKDYIIDNIKLIKKERSESENVTIEECLFSVYDDIKKKIHHFDLIKKKTIYIFELNSELNENGFAMHPNTHIFIVTLKNKELIVFNIIEHSIIYKTNINNEYGIVNYNKTGILYACTVNCDSIFLYSCVSDEYNDEYFADFNISSIVNKTNRCIYIDFSYDEKKMLVLTENLNLYSLDAYDGIILCKYDYNYDQDNLNLKYFLSFPIYTFDSNYVISGGKDGNLHIWNVKGSYYCKKKSYNNIMFIKWIYNKHAFITTSNYIALWSDENIGKSLKWS